MQIGDVDNWKGRTGEAQDIQNAATENTGKEGKEQIMKQTNGCCNWCKRKAQWPIQ